MTGAIVESVLKIEENGSTGEIKVSFRHDPVLGMWVPAEMTETYQAMTQRSLSGAPRAETIVEGTREVRQLPALPGEDRGEGRHPEVGDRRLL